MSAYIYRRIALIPPTLFLVSLMIFLIMRVLPGDVAGAILTETSSAEDLERFREQVGLNEPLHEQYLTWVGNLLVLDFGESIISGQPVAETLQTAIPVTLELLLISLSLGLGLGIPFGILSAINRGKLIDYLARFLAILNLSVPSFVFGLLFILLPVIWFGWSPRVLYHPIWKDPIDNLLQFSFPAIMIALRLAAINARMTRSAMLEVLASDYVRTARAKGLGNRVVYTRHALRNAMIPVITIFGIQAIGAIGGSVIAEQIFGLPGVGRYLVASVTARDYIAVQGVVVVLAMFAVLINILVDLTYTVLDPRLRT